MNAKQLMKAGLFTALSLSCLAPLVFAGLLANTIDPVALVTDRGRHVLMAGPITCTAGERAALKAMFNDEGAASGADALEH